MASPGQAMVNPATGERIVFRRTTVLRPLAAVARLLGRRIP